MYYISDEIDQRQDEEEDEKFGMLAVNMELRAANMRQTVGILKTLNP